MTEDQGVNGMRASKTVPNVDHGADRTNDDVPVSESIVLDEELPDGYRLLQTVHAEVWNEGNVFVADAEALSIHAFGPNRTAAIQSLQREIVEHYRFLQGLGDKISPAAREEARRFRDWIAAPDA
jgi:hypothetical protein